MGGSVQEPQTPCCLVGGSEDSSLSCWGGMMVAGTLRGNELGQKTNLSGPWFL